MGLITAESTPQTCFCTQACGKTTDVATHPAAGAAAGTAAPQCPAAGARAWPNRRGPRAGAPAWTAPSPGLRARGRRPPRPAPDCPACVDKLKGRPEKQHDQQAISYAPGLWQHCQRMAGGARLPRPNRYLTRLILHHCTCLSVLSTRPTRFLHLAWHQGRVPRSSAMQHKAGHPALLAQQDKQQQRMQQPQAGRTAEARSRWHARTGSRRGRCA